MSNNTMHVVDDAALRTTLQELKKYMDDNVVMNSDLESKVNSIINGTEPEPSPDEPEEVFPNVIYGFHVNGQESDPAARVTYTDANKDFTPAHMNFETGQFDYGDWANAFFIKKLKPVMLNIDGTVAYELDPNDYTKKKDGSPSDISNEDFEGEAMIAFPKVYYKFEILDSEVSLGDGTATYSYNVWISNYKADNNYKCWSHISSTGEECDYCYMSIYETSMPSTRMRSLSGKTPVTNMSASNLRNYGIRVDGNKDDTGWSIKTFADHILLQILTTLISRSTNSQASFGKGACSSNTILTTGTMDDKGLFWGSDLSTEGVKIFGIENVWGNVNTAIVGWTYNASTKYYYTKLTYGTSDGTEGSGYAVTSRYNQLWTGTEAFTDYGYVTQILMSPSGVVPHVRSTSPAGSSSTYYCDRFEYESDTSEHPASVGGSRTSGLAAGIFSVSFHTTQSATMGTMLSYHA